MTMDIYQEVTDGVYEKISIDGDFTNPIATTHHSRSGDTVIKKLYVRCDDTHTYSNIQVTPKAIDGVSDIGSGSSPGDTGWGIKVWNGGTGNSVSTRTPSQDDWNDQPFGDATLTFASTADPTVYQPFWLCIVSPPVTQVRVQNKQNIGLCLTYIETV